QVPVNQVLRIQGQPDNALTIQNTSSTVTSAWVNTIITGDYTTGLGITGLSLNWVSNGVLTTQQILYSALVTPTISALADAITAYGNGFGAIVNTPYSTWPVTSLRGANVSQGCGISDTSGAQLWVYSQDLPNARMIDDQGYATGMLYTTNRGNGFD